ncbi:hypothetical protein BLNAU_4759 [Blattamonas nauphoetae]|uniref:Uncharacterized protein n=1 Tax=Blattamonas nauphoetae TaxID=2049346 RepID=A0ABQ9Y8V9_9EUKA|nr:hypothetical protein BLNAU_4759 [Blattamonas nauphoetae]
MSRPNKSYPRSSKQSSTLPRFLTPPSARFKSLEHASPFLVSLVRYIEEGNTLDEAALHKAEIVLDKLLPHFQNVTYVGGMFTRLVPSGKDSPDGFFAAFLTLLTSGYTSIVHLSLQLLRDILYSITVDKTFSLVCSGFFVRLTPTIPWIIDNMTAESHHHLFSVIVSSMLGQRHYIVDYIPTHSFDSIQQILYEQVLQPAGSYLSWCCENRHALAMASPKSFKVAGLLLMLLQLGLESSAFDCKHMFPSHRQQWKDIQQKLDDEGLADELDAICFWETRSYLNGLAIRQKHSLLMNYLAANVPRH